MSTRNLAIFIFQKQYSNLYLLLSKLVTRSAVGRYCQLSLPRRPTIGFNSGLRNLYGPTDKRHLTLQYTQIPYKNVYKAIIPIVGHVADYKISCSVVVSTRPRQNKNNLNEFHVSSTSNY